MNVYFDLNMVGNCCVQIIGTTQNYDDFSYKNTYTINVIKYISTKDTNILKTIIVSHVDSEGNELEDKTQFHLSKDGHYVIEHLIIPNKDFIDTLNDYSTYDCLYATDGYKFYKKNSNETKWQECDINDIITSEFKKTTISKASQDTFSICILNKKYLELCKNQFCKLTQNPCLHVKELHNFELDLLWMGINAIKYNVEFGNLFQAQLLLEEIISCTGISLLHKSVTNKKINDCGCL